MKAGGEFSALRSCFRGSEQQTAIDASPKASLRMFDLYMVLNFLFLFWPSVIFFVIATFVPHSRAPARQEEIISGLHLCSSHLYKGKKSGVVSGKRAPPR